MVHRRAPRYTTEAVLSNSSTFPSLCWIQYPWTFQTQKKTSYQHVFSHAKFTSLFVVPGSAGSFWSNALLQRLYQQTQSLAQSLAGYADYLSSQNKIMKDLHARSNPGRQLSDSMSVKYIELCRGVPIIRLEPLLGCLQEREDGEYIVLNEISPDRDTNLFNAWKQMDCLYQSCFLPTLLATMLEICTSSRNCHPVNHWKRPFKTVLGW